MPKSGPATKFVIELSRHAVEGPFGTTGFVIISPTANEGVNGPNQAGLRAAAIVTDNLFEMGQMALLGFLLGQMRVLKPA